MKTKILGLFVCVILIATIPAVGGLEWSELNITFLNSYPLKLDYWKQNPELLDDRDNQSPVLGIPSPDNNSFNNPLSFYWNISISDPEGDRFDWSIQCNGQTNDDKGDVNGTKSLEFTGLDYKTTYTVWVNATDGQGSGNTTTKWYFL